MANTTPLAATETPAASSSHPTAAKPSLWLILGYLTLYLALDQFTTLFETAPGVSPWYPPPGLSLALLLGCGLLYTPALFVAALLAIALNPCCRAAPVAWVIMATSITVGYALAAALLRHGLRIDMRLQRLRDLGWLVGVAFGTNLLVGAPAVAGLAGSGLMAWSAYWYTLLQFWIGDAIGVMILTPFLLIHVLPWVNRRQQRQAAIPAGSPTWHWPTPFQQLELCGQIASVLIALWAAFGSPPAREFHLFYLCFLPLIWIVLRYGLPGASLLNLAMSVGVILVVHFADFVFLSLAELQIFMLALVLTSLLLGVTVSESRVREVALRRSEGLYRTMAQNFPNGAIFLFDRDLRFTLADGAGLAAAKLTREQIEGKTLWETRPPASVERLLPYYQQALAGQPSIFEVPYEDRVYQTHITPIRNERGEIQGGMVITQEITEHKRATTEIHRLNSQLEQRVDQRTHELTTLLQAASNLTSTLELTPLLRLILEQLQSVVAYDGAAIFTLANERELKLLLYRGPIPQAELRSTWPLAQDQANAQVINRRQPVIIPDTHADTPLARAYQVTAGQHLRYIRTWMGVPLIFKDRVIGMLGFDHTQPYYYSPHHAELALAFASQAAIAIENARLYAQAHTLAALEERQKLARELHDSVSQALYGINLGAQTARELLGSDPAAIAQPLDYVVALADAALIEMRALIFELRPESLEMEGLVVALTRQVDAVRARHRLAVSTDFCPEPPVALAVKEAFYRITQEALHNIVKHAHASRVEVRLAQQDAQLALQIDDDGRGFDPTRSFPGHLGLHSMRERAEQLGGHCRITSAPGQGTHIQVAIPIKDRAL